MSAEPRSAKRRLVKIVWGVSWGALVFAWVWPINEGPIRLLLLLGLTGVWLGALVLFWPRKWIRYIGIGAPALLAAFLCLPGRSGHRERLRSDYLCCLRSYTGARYIWGGESRLGIDCSGLVRCGLMKANLRIGFAYADPGLVRRAISMWWFDTSARALRDGYRDLTRPVTEVKKLNGFDHEGLLAGDLACAADGVHILAYVGDRTWISAAPGRTVREFRAEPPNESWFEVPVKIVRWAQLDDDRG
jgi:hypothetical protein